MTLDLPDEAQGIVFPTVAALDAVLNSRVRAADSEEAVDAALRLKLRVKRRLVRLPDAVVESAAAIALRALDRLPR
jgi:hypothetical protein